MTTTRAYRDALLPEWAMGEVRRGAGSQFDPAVVRAMERVIAAGEAEADRKAA
jgi:HD-GYP domain-containing protein (c-di-GMP phosphodiesterase class II)